MHEFTVWVIASWGGYVDTKQRFIGNRRNVRLIESSQKYWLIDSFDSKKSKSKRRKFFLGTYYLRLVKYRYLISLALIIDAFFMQ